MTDQLKTAIQNRIAALQKRNRDRHHMRNYFVTDHPTRCLEPGQCLDIRYVDDLARSIQHKGWYADDMQHATYRGVVVQIANSKAVPGYECSDSGMIVVDPSEVYSFDMEDNDTLRDCILAADSFAESHAERDREYREKESAIYDLSERVCELRQTIHDYRRLARQSSQDATLYFQNKIQECKDQLSETIDFKGPRVKEISPKHRLPESNSLTH